MAESIAAGLAASTLREDATPAHAPAPVTPAACFYIAAQIETGHHCQRVKDKLGSRSNASSEVEFADAFAWRVGEEGRGVRTIINMVQLTRFDCATASAGIMRMALAQAIHHTRYRSVFQKHLVDQPMMRAVLADLALDVEGAPAPVMRLPPAYHLPPGGPSQAARA